MNEIEAITPCPKGAPTAAYSRGFSPARFDLAAVAVTKDGAAVCIVGSSYWELETVWRKLMPTTPFNRELVQAVRILSP